MDFLEKGCTITGQSYSRLLSRFDEKLKEAQPHLAKKNVIFQYDNAPAHSLRIVAAQLHELRYELQPHPPYTPDMAPCDFFLLFNMKTWLAGKKFSSKEEIIVQTEAYFIIIIILYI